MANHLEQQSMIEQLQKETNEKLKKQDHIISKLEKKIDKMQQQNHAQMQTLDVRMQQMMGMFQMFMMNQTIGLNQNPNQTETQQQQLQPTGSHSLSNAVNPPNLPQSKSAMHIIHQDNANANANTNTNTNTNTNEHKATSKQLRIVTKVKKSRSIGNLEDDHVRTPDSEYESEVLSADEQSKSRDHSRSRRKHKRKSKKERKKEKKERKKEKEKGKRRHKHRDKKEKEKDTTNTTPVPPSYPYRKRGESLNSLGTTRPVPPPPPKDALALRSANSLKEHQPPPPSREGREGREEREETEKPKKHKHTKKDHSKHREQSKSRSKHKHHEKSQSEDAHKKYHKNIQVIDFVPIDTTYGNESPTKSESGLLDRLDLLELDVDTPSDEESLLYVCDDALNQQEDGHGMDESYNWNANKQKKKNKTIDHDDEDSGDSGDDDISILSLSKQPGAAAATFDGEDLGDSDYSGYDDDDSSTSDSSDNEHKKRKRERKKQKKRDKKRRKKEAKKREKRRKKENNHTSLDLSVTSGIEEAEDQDTEKAKKKEKEKAKERSTITKKIKQIGQKFKIGKNDNNNDAPIMKDDSNTHHEGRTQRAKTSVTTPELETKKRRFPGLRSFKARQFGKDKGNDDNLVDYGDRNTAKIKHKKHNKKPRRGSDSNISNMALTTDPWFDEATQTKTKKKQKHAFTIDIGAREDILQPDFDLDDVTPPPSPMYKEYNAQITEDEEDEEEFESDDDEDEDDELEIADKLQDDISDAVHIKKSASIDDYTKSRGSKSTSKDIIVSDDIDPSSVGPDEFDPDIDVGDYDWNVYTAKPKAKPKTKGKSKAKSKTKLKQTQSDEDIPISTQKDMKNKVKSAKRKPQQPTRPQSARIGSHFTRNNANKMKEENTTQSNKKEKEKKEKKSPKQKKKKEKKQKKPKNINIISEDKKVKSQKKKKAIAMTPTPTATDTTKTMKKNKKLKKRGSARLFDRTTTSTSTQNKKKQQKQKKKNKKQKLQTPPPQSPQTPQTPQSPYDDTKEPEVLDRARGQSIKQTLNPSQYHTEVEYIFANKKLKSIVPKMNYNEYENDCKKPEFGLEMQHVIGYMGYDNLCRNNLYSLNDGSLLYNVGCLAVIHDLDRNEQEIYRYHQSAITSITVSHGTRYIASASLSSIHIWHKLSVKSRIEIIGEVRHLNFSPYSNLLYCTNNCTIVSYDTRAQCKAWMNVKLNTANNKTVQIYGMIFNENVDNKACIDEFVVFGLNILYWCQVRQSGTLKYCKINKLPPKGLTDGKKEKAYHCGLFVTRYYVLGAQSGTIYIGYRNTILMSLSGHSNRIQSIVKFNYSANQFISVAYDGMWKVWNIDYDDKEMQEIASLINDINDNDAGNHDNDNDEEYEQKRWIPDFSDKIMKSDAVSVLCEDSFVPSNDNISKQPHSAYYDIDHAILYIGTACNSIISVSSINVKHGDNDLQIIASGHNLGVVGVAISPKLDSLIATLSEDGLLRLWNIFKSTHYGKNKALKNKENKAKRLDDCVALQSLIPPKQQNKLKSTVIAWSPDGKYIATGYNVSRVSLCTAHPLKKVHGIDLSQYKSKGKAISGKQAITALCFSYDKNVLAVAHCTHLSLFNMERNSNKKCSKWDLTLGVYAPNKDSIKHLYFSEEDDMLCVISQKYDTKFYNISMKKRSITEALRLPKADIVWWPRIPLTSYILKGLYLKNTMKWNKSELCDADICQSLKVVASADNKGIIRLHKLPALNERAHNAFKHHHGSISKILFIPDHSILISVGKDDRSIIRCNVNELL